LFQFKDWIKWGKDQFQIEIGMCNLRTDSLEILTMKFYSKLTHLFSLYPSLNPFIHSNLLSPTYLNKIGHPADAFQPQLKNHCPFKVSMNLKFPFFLTMFQFNLKAINLMWHTFYQFNSSNRNEDLSLTPWLAQRKCLH
jgi:hypothetical protein